MANLTKAQRHNKNMDQIFNKYHELENARKNLLPSCTDYSFYIQKATTKFSITADEARNLHGSKTYGQWKELLQLF